MKPTLQVTTGQPLTVGDFVGVEALPATGLPHLDPFLVLHHVATELMPGTDPRHAGVGPHPHRGFAPVSLILEGGVHHRDSAGHDSVIRAGGTQWMHAGHGVVHSERPDPELARAGGRLELIQLWVNSPARHKLDAPAYWGLEEHDTPLTPAEAGVSLRLVSGTYAGATGPIRAFSPVTLLRGELKAGARTAIHFAAGWRGAVYLLSGAVSLGGTAVAAQQLANWTATNEALELTATADSRLIVLGGEPLNEPIAAYGPFVMNTADEIKQAMRDYANGRMGELAE